jgi:hypothetical protein
MANEQVIVEVAFDPIFEIAYQSLGPGPDALELHRVTHVPFICIETILPVTGDTKTGTASDLICVIHIAMAPEIEI